MVLQTSRAAGALIGGTGGQAALTGVITLVDNTRRGLTSFERRIDRIESRSLRGFTRGLALAGKATIGLTAGIAVAARGIAGFEKQIAGIAAITGASTVGALADVRNEAIQLSTQFAASATEIAEGQRFIAQTGAKSNEILNATRPILELATATMENFDLAAKLTIRTLNAYGLAISNISDTTRVVNDLQFAVNNSVNTLTTLNDALKFSAPFASVLGLQLEDLISVLQLTANAGLEAGIAGRSLGQGLQQLIRSGMRGASGEAKEFADALAGTVNSGGNLADIVRLLEVRFGGLSEANRQQLSQINQLSEAELDAVESGQRLITTTGVLSELIQVFGVRGARVFAVLLGQSRQLDEFRTQMELQVVTAAEQAQVALQNFADQAQISINKVQAGILNSRFGEVLKEQFEALNETGALDELGEELGDALAKVAEDIIPTLTTTLTTLTDVLQGILPIVTGFTSVLAGIGKGFAGVAEFLPDTTKKLLGFSAALFLIGKRVGLVGVLSKQFGSAAIGAGAFALQTQNSALALNSMKVAIGQQIVQLGALRGTRALTEKQYQLALKESLGHLAAVQQAEARLLRQRQTGGALRGRGGRLAGGALLAGGILSAGVAQETGSTAGAAIGGALSGALTGAFVGNVVPVIGPFVGAIGGALIGGVTSTIRSNKSKQDMKDSFDSLTDALQDPSVAAKFENIGNDAAKRYAAAFELAMKIEGDSISNTIDDILSDNDFNNLTAAVGQAFGNARFNVDGRSGTIFGDVGDTRKQNIAGSRGDAFREFFSIPTLDEIKSLFTKGETRADEFADIFTGRKEIIPEFDRLAKLVGLEADATQENVQLALDQGVLEKQVLTGATQILKEQEKLRAELEERAKREAADRGIVDPDAVTKFVENFVANNLTSVSFDDAVQASVQALVDQGLPVQFAQALANTVKGEGIGIEGFNLSIDSSGNVVLEGDFGEIDRSVLDKILAGAGGELSIEDLVKNLLGDGEDLLLPTANELGREITGLVSGVSNLTLSTARTKIKLDEMELAVEKAKVSLSQLDLSITKSAISGFSTLNSVLVSNGIGFQQAGISFIEAQENATKAKVFQQVQSIADAQFQIDQLRLNKKIKSQEQRVRVAKLVLEENVLAGDEALLEVKRTELLVRLEILKALKAQLTGDDVATAAILKSLESAATIAEAYFDETERQLTDIQKTQRVIATNNQKLQGLYEDQVDSVEDQEALMKSIAAKLGINLNAIDAITEENLLALAETILQQEKIKQTNAAIDRMLSPANSLGDALENSRDLIISMGFSASAVDDAMKQFREIQFLNSVLGFVNNFQELADATGQDLGLGQTIASVQQQILQRGAGFLDDLVRITGDPTTLSEIFARSTMIQQSVTQTTSVNLQAELIFPDGITPDQREEISKIAVDALGEAAGNTPFLD